MSTHIAYGPKSKIPSVIESREIPRNCLVITKVDDEHEKSELFFYDSNYTQHQIFTKDIFNSVSDAEDWIEENYYVGHHIVINDGGEWHAYIVDENNDLRLCDGSDNVHEISAEDASISVGGTTSNPTIGVTLDPFSNDGLEIGDYGLKLNDATSESSGAMSPADKAKLTEIESGAQVNRINSITQGLTNGTISVNGVDVAVKGLGSAAFTSSSSYAPSGTGMERMIVQELPEVGDSDTIYLVRNTGENEDIYNEYMFINGRYELLGTTKTDLSDYYTKTETDSQISSALSDAVSTKADISSLSTVATSGSYNDLSDKPAFPIILNVSKRGDYYYPEMYFSDARNLMSRGLQCALYWPENNMVYPCILWKDTSSYMYFGVQDNATFRILQWNGNNERVTPSTNVSFVTTSQIGTYYTKGEIDALLENYVHSSAIQWMYKHKGSVATFADLPTTNNVVGDVYDVRVTGMNYVWTGAEWDALGESADVASIENSDIDNIVP